MNSSPSTTSPSGRSQPQQIIQLLTEARQQKIVAFVRRQGDSHVLQFTLTPELVDNPSVDRAFLLRPGPRLHSHHELGYADRQAIARCH